LDIKSRSIRYSIIMKAAAVFLIWVSFAGMFATAVFVERYSSDIDKSKYSETNNFYNLFNNSIGNAIDNFVLPNLAQNAYGSTGSGDRPSKLPDMVNLKLIARNYKTGAVISNFDMKGKTIEQVKKEFEKYKTYLFYSSGESSFSKNLDSSYMSGYAMKLDFLTIEIFAAVADNPVPGDGFYELMTAHDKVHGLIPVFVAIAGVSLILGIGCFIYLIIVAGRREKKGEIVPAFVDWLYNDVHTILAVYLAGLPMNQVRMAADSSGGDIHGIITVFLLLSIPFMIGLNYVLSMIRQIKMGTIFKHTLIFALLKMVKSIFIHLFSAKSFKPSILVLLPVYGGLNSIVFALAIYAGNQGWGSKSGFWIFLIIQLIFNIMVIYYVSKTLGSITAIMVWVKEMAKGNFEHKLEKDRLSLAFTMFANDIASLQTGIKYAVSEAIKGERLKTELITNVSHDLKTPLTSIINYVDLLKKENLENETVNEYISVLEEKAGRLKKLIEDLIEASKAASGDIRVNLENVDLCSLAGQAVAEYNEKILNNGLDFRIRQCEKPVVVKGDGTLVWRIMDNLLSNIVKYSQKNSRVYIEIEQTETAGVLTIKNISEMPLDMSVDQLLERFVRGDSSRSTEGSGLGLSIAKSLAGLQGGKLELSIDGDLFKVIVSLPVSIES
jgi:signal transduction histidine kinase